MGRALLAEADGARRVAVAAGAPLPLWPWAEPPRSRLGKKEGNSGTPEAMLHYSIGKEDVSLGLCVCVQEGDWPPG